MKIHYSFDNLPEIKNPVVTTGSFDGVHVGHNVIIQRLKKLAGDVNGETVLVSFSPHPRKVLYPETAGKDLKMICSQDEKKILLEEIGLDHLIIINFTIEFAQIRCEKFVEEFLHNRLGAKVIVIGFNHQFGFNREGNFEYLFQLSRKLGFEVEEIPEQDIHNESVSSTKIRQALISGNIQRANAYLDHYYFIKADVEIDNERSEQSGLRIYSLKIDDDDKLIPAEGVYAANLLDKKGNLIKSLVWITKESLKESEHSSQTIISLCCPDHEISDSGHHIVYFHKLFRRISGSYEYGFDKKQVESDLRQIKELIY